MSLTALSLAVAPAAISTADQSIPASFVDLAAAIPTLHLDLRYYGDDNFVGTRIEGYEAPVCYLTDHAAAALAGAQAELEPFGLGLKVFDGYRPTRAVAHFARWVADAADTGRKADYYPDLDKADLFRLGYIAAHSGHSRGSTVDLTLVDLASGEELDMGSRFDLFSPISWPAERSVPAAARANRLLLLGLMRRHGFRGVAEEWWHFTLEGEPFPDSYFDFPIR